MGTEEQKPNRVLLLSTKKSDVQIDRREIHPFLNIRIHHLIDGGSVREIPIEVGFEIRNRWLCEHAYPLKLKGPDHQDQGLRLKAKGPKLLPY